MNYKDDEMIELKKKFIIGISLFLVIAIPYLLFLSSKLIKRESKIIKKINNQESMFILVCNDNNDSCKKINKYLKDEKVAHDIIYEIDNDYTKIINKLDTYKPEVVTPSILVVVEGKTYAILNKVEINEELDTFLDNYVDRDE